MIEIMIVIIIEVKAINNSEKIPILANNLEVRKTQ